MKFSATKEKILEGLQQVQNVVSTRTTLPVAVCGPITTLSRWGRKSPNFEVAILLTKADLVSTSQLEVVVEFTRHQIARLTGKDLPILPCSIHQTHGELQGRVRDHLLHRIAERARP